MSRGPKLFADFVAVRLPRTQRRALVRLAMVKRISLSEYIRMVLDEHLHYVFNTRQSSVIHLRRLVLLSKKYVLEQRSVWIASKLPGTEKRQRLEEVAWQAVQEAIEYSKSEDAAKNARYRLLALRVADDLIRTELAILDSTDWAYVDDILESVEDDTDELEKEVKASPQETGEGAREPSLQSEAQKETRHLPR